MDVNYKQVLISFNFHIFMFMAEAFLFLPLLQHVRSNHPWLGLLPNRCRPCRLADHRFSSLVLMRVAFVRGPRVQDPLTHLPTQ